MGGRSSRPSEASAFLSFVSDITIKSSSTCLAAAEATILLQFQQSQNVTFKDVNLVARATSTVDDCKQSLTVQIPGIQSSVSAAIAELGHTHLSRHDDVARLQSAFQQALTADVIKSAIDTATAQYKMQVQQVQGNVQVANLSITQNATAELKTALESTHVRDSTGITRPLGDILSDAFAHLKPCPEQTQRNVAIGSLSLVSLTTLVLLFKKI